MLLEMLLKSTICYRKQHHPITARWAVNLNLNPSLEAQKNLNPGLEAEENQEVEEIETEELKPLVNTKRRRLI